MNRRKHTRVPWPESSAPLKLNVSCPICRSFLLLSAGAKEQNERGEWIATSITINCTSAPPVDSNDWPAWYTWHYDAPYIDWAPIEQRVLREVRRRFYFQP